MVEHERFTKGSLVEERKWLESAVEVVQAIQEPEDITITDVVFHSRQENAVEPHEHGTPQHKSRQGCSEFLAENNSECLWHATIYALSKQIQFTMPDQYGLQLYLPLIFKNMFDPPIGGICRI